MKSILWRPSIQFLMALTVVATVMVLANAAAATSNPTPNPTPNGVDMKKANPLSGGPTIPGSKPLTYPSLPAGPGPAHGIVNNNVSPFPSDQFDIHNEWQDVVAGQWVQVYAGSIAGDPSQGVVIVRVSPLDWSTTTTVGVYPVRAGALRIVSAVNSTLVLQTPGGSHLRFDAAARKFL